MQLDAYELLKEEELTGIHSDGMLLRHKKSGAKIIIISNTDENKVFSIGFRTPPSDACGTPHIIEHTVLCGSDKFPAKDPFVELVKGSMNTFLNAMTYPDKTVFPVASCNDKDFQNLMDVYMDAVLHPNIYKNKKIFQQEGWHYELEDPEGPITLNGVVYNEMKGAYSSPDELLTQLCDEALFPDTCYGQDSGGTPSKIPDLTYEQFLDFHRKYYHPSNSYIYLYGDMDVEEKLCWLDEAYLNQYDQIEVDSQIKKQKPFDAPKEEHHFYPISEDESERDNTYFAYVAVTSDNLNREHYVAFSALEYALVNSPGAPLKKALIDAGIGTEINASHDASRLQPCFSIEALNANPEQKEEFMRIVRNVLEDQVKHGINQKSLEGFLNREDFSFREADYGRTPKGLIYGIVAMDSWLYDEEQPFLHLDTLNTIKDLKAKIGTGYFEELIDQYLLKNPHTVLITMEPKKGLTAENEQKLEKKLAEYKASLSEEEIAQLIADTKELKAYQEAPTPKEDLEKIPMLTRSDMRKEPVPFCNEEKEIEGVKVLHHNLWSNGIQYLTLFFQCMDVTEEEIPYIGLLCDVLGNMDMEHYSYGAWNHELDIATGGMTTRLASYRQNRESFLIQFEVATKVVYDRMPQAFALMEEMLFHTKLEDEKRLHEIISERKSRLQYSISSSGNSYAMMHAMAAFSAAHKVDELCKGISYYEKVKEWDENFEQEKETIIAKLKELLPRILRRDKLMIGTTCEEEGFALLRETLPEFLTHFYTQPVKQEKLLITCNKKNEAFKDASKIQYVACAGSYAKKGLGYHGAFRILRVILSYDYLWIQVRVKGGAYGCGANFTRNGEVIFSSYRDPNLKKTYEIYQKVVGYIRDFEVDERDMTKYIIGTFSEMDAPMSAAALGRRSEMAYFNKLSIEELQKEREQILAAQPEDIRALAQQVEAALADCCLCVVGNENKIEEDKELFEQIQNL